MGKDTEEKPEVIIRKRREVESATWEEQQEFVLKELKKVYTEFVLPIEEEFRYESFKPSFFSDQLISCIPMVMFVGPFSAGKTTFINYLLGGDHLWTGPEPTTNKYTVVFHGEDNNAVSGEILAANPTMPFKGLQRFGREFLNGFSGHSVKSELLKSVMLVDTPGVLETSNLHQRSYDYIEAMKWFVERADLVFVMFDPTKLDAGRELRETFDKALKGHESRIRIVLNKADSIGQHELMKVHGALFWNLSNLISSSEPPRVYVSSFWAQPYKPTTNHELFESEKQSLMYDLLHVVPHEAIDRKVASMLRRAQDVMIHAMIVGKAREKLPKYFGKRNKKIETIDNIDQIIAEIQSKKHIPAANFPHPEVYKQWFCKFDLCDFPRLKEWEEKTGALARCEKVTNEDIPSLLQSIKSETAMDPRKNKLLQSVRQRQRREAEQNGVQAQQGGFRSQKQYGMSAAEMEGAQMTQFIGSSTNNSMSSIQPAVYGGQFGGQQNTPMGMGNQNMGGNMGMQNMGGIQQGGIQQGGIQQGGMQGNMQHQGNMGVHQANMGMQQPNTMGMQQNNMGMQQGNMGMQGNDGMQHGNMGNMQGNMGMNNMSMGYNNQQMANMQQGGMGMPPQQGGGAGGGGAMQPGGMQQHQGGMQQSGMQQGMQGNQGMGGNMVGGGEQQQQPHGEPGDQQLLHSFQPNTMQQSQGYSQQPQQGQNMQQHVDNNPNMQQAMNMPMNPNMQSQPVNTQQPQMDQSHSQGYGSNMMSSGGSQQGFQGSPSGDMQQEMGQPQGQSQGNPQ